MWGNKLLFEKKKNFRIRENWFVIDDKKGFKLRWEKYLMVFKFYCFFFIVG